MFLQHCFAMCCLTSEGSRYPHGLPCALHQERLGGNCWLRAQAFLGCIDIRLRIFRTEAIQESKRGEKGSKSFWSHRNVLWNTCGVRGLVRVDMYRYVSRMYLVKACFQGQEPFRKTGLHWHSNGWVPGQQPASYSMHIQEPCQIKQSLCVCAHKDTYIYIHS